jgi:hypothetical protein
VKNLIPLILIFILTACSQESIIHIELPMTYGLQVDNEITSVKTQRGETNSEQLGTIIDVKLFDGGRAILVSAKLNAGVKIPVNSEFEVVPTDILGHKMIAVSYSSESNSYQNNDTVEGFYIDPIENMIDSLLINSMDQIMDASALLDAVDSSGFLDSIFGDRTPVHIPTH